MADGIDCITCGYNETIHRNPQWADADRPPCDNYDDGCTPDKLGPPEDQCSKYPNCPERTFLETLREPAHDEETCSSSGSFGDVTYEGPCMGECRRRRKIKELKEIRRMGPLNTAVYLLTPHGYVDIGS